MKYKYKAKDYRSKVAKYWKHIEDIEDTYWSNINRLEEMISKDLGIKDIEIFHSDNSIVGIGTTSRDMELIQRK